MRPLQVLAVVHTALPTVAELWNHMCETMRQVNKCIIVHVVAILGLVYGVLNMTTVVQRTRTVVMLIVFS